MAGGVSGSWAWVAGTQGEAGASGSVTTDRVGGGLGCGEWQGCHRTPASPFSNTAHSLLKTTHGGPVTGLTGT